MYKRRREEKIISFFFYFCFFFYFIFKMCVLPFKRQYIMERYFGGNRFLTYAFRFQLGDLSVYSNSNILWLRLIWSSSIPIMAFFEYLDNDRKLIVYCSVYWLCAMVDTTALTNMTWDSFKTGFEVLTQHDGTQIHSYRSVPFNLNDSTICTQYQCNF